MSFSVIPDICVATSLRIPRELKENTFSTILDDLLKEVKARAVVMFVNEDNIRRLLAETRRLGITGHFHWLASDSWGAKTYPIQHQEFAAEGAVTILPQRKVLEGEYLNIIKAM